MREEIMQQAPGMRCDLFHLIPDFTNYCRPSTFYRWAEEVNMVFNGDKFEMLRFWPGRSQKPDHL